MADASAEVPACRICLDEEVAEGDELLTPCCCAGTMRFVHRSCLDQWRVDGFNPKTMTHCGTCGTKFRFEDTAESAAMGAQAEVWLQIARFLGLRVGVFLVVAIALGFAPPWLLGAED